MYDFRDSDVYVQPKSNPATIFKYTYDFIILKMNTVTIHYVSDFHTKNVIIKFRFSGGAIIG
jgi:hypothetical protein